MRMRWLFGRSNVRAPWIVALLVLINALLLRAIDPTELSRLRDFAFDSYQRLQPRAYNPQTPVRIGRTQAVVATASLLADRSNRSSTSAGVFQSSVFRGRALRAAATAAISSVLCSLRSVPFGKYWRSNPLVFSLVPRCHGL